MSIIMHSAKNLNRSFGLNPRGIGAFVASLRKPLGSFFVRSTVDCFPVAVLLFFLCGFSFASEPPKILPVTTWFVGNNEALASLLTNWEQGIGTSLGFYGLPEEIDSDSPWFGATLTDGNQIWAVMIFHAKGEIANAADFRARLFKNTLIKESFLGGQIGISEESGKLYVYSKDFSYERLGQLELKERWKEIMQKSYIGMITEFPERELLPTLPPESPEEGMFIKKIREKREENGGKISDLESVFFGAVWDKDQTLELLFEPVAVEGSATAEEYQRWQDNNAPYGVGGFLHESGSFQVAYRLLPHDFFNAASFISFYSGMSLIPPEERENSNHRYSLQISAGMNSSLPEDETKCHFIHEDCFVAKYPLKSPSDFHEENTVSSEMLDEINRDLAQKNLAFLTGIRQAALSLEKDKPVDIAIQLDGDMLVLGISFPPGGIGFDGDSFEQMMKSWFVLFEKTPSLGDDGKPMQGENIRYQSILSAPQNLEGLSFRKYVVASVGTSNGNMEPTPLCGVVGTGSDFFCLAVGLSFFISGGGDETDDEPSMEAVDRWNDAALVQLKTQYLESQRLKTEKMLPPLQILAVDSGDRKIQLENETEGRRTSYRLKINQQSLAGLAQLLKAFGGDSIRSLLLGGSI